MRSTLPLLICCLLFIGTAQASAADGAAGGANPHGPTAVRFTFPAHTHFSVKAGYAMEILYRGGAHCTLQVRRDAGKITMLTISPQEDARGLLVNAGEMLGNISASPCYLGVAFYPSAGAPGSDAYTAITRNQ